MCGEKVDWFEKLADFHRIASYLDNIDLLVNVSQSLLKGSGFLPLSLSPHKLLIARHACRAQAAGPHTKQPRQIIAQSGLRT